MFIRSSSLLAVLALTVGCSPENTLHGRHSAEAVSEMNIGVSPFVPPTHSTDTADTGGMVDTAQDDTATTDTGTGTYISNCEGTYLDHDSLGNMVETSSFPDVVFTVPTGNTVYLKQGDPLVLEATFGAKDGCGAYLVRELDWHVYDFSSGAVWIYYAYNTMPASNLVETTTPQVFADYASEYAGFGLDADGNIVDGGTEWIWRTPESGWAVGAEIVSQRVEESAAMKYQFTWNGSGSAPVGETLVFTLQFGWNDLATGAIMAPNDADRELTVIITE